MRVLILSALLGCGNDIGVMSVIRDPVKVTLTCTVP